MKKLLSKLCIAGLLVFMITAGLSFLSVQEGFNSMIDMLTNSVSYQGVGKIETIDLLERVKQSKGAPKLVMGDSVANQIYSYKDNETYEILCGNMSMTLVWQYVFAEEYLNLHSKTEEIILCIVPETLEKSFETERTYSYMLIPLLESGKMEVLGETEKKLLSEMYGSFFITPKMIERIGSSGLNTKLYLNGVQKFYELFPGKKEEVEKKDEIDFTISQLYIGKIKELCDNRGVGFRLLPNPVKDIPENREKLKLLEEKYRQSSLYEINPEFFDQVLLFEEEMFKDELHFKDEFLEKGGKDEIIREVQKVIGHKDRRF